VRDTVTGRWQRRARRVCNCACEKDISAVVVQCLMVRGLCVFVAMSHAIHIYNNTAVMYQCVCVMYRVRDVYLLHIFCSLDRRHDPRSVTLIPLRYYTSIFIFLVQARYLFTFFLLSNKRLLTSNIQWSVDRPPIDHNTYSISFYIMVCLL